MCDYSLHVYPNRLAAEGEELVVHRFGGASLGLASPSDLRPVITTNSCDPTSKRPWSWTAIKGRFLATSPPRQPDKRTQQSAFPGARLLLKDIPIGLQRKIGVVEVEEVKFVEISAEVNTYRDAVSLKNSCQLLLQALARGTKGVTVLSLTPAEVEEITFPDVRREQVR